MSGNRSESGNGAEQVEGPGSTDMIVRKSEVNNFLRTLKSCADSFAQSKKNTERMHAEMTELAKRCDQCAEKCSIDNKAARESVREDLDEVTAHIANVNTREQRLAGEREVLLRLSKKAQENFLDCRSAAGRVQFHEDCTRSYVDVIKRTERKIR